MPEDTLPDGVGKGRREHLLFITLTAAVDYQRDAHQLWEAIRARSDAPQVGGKLGYDREASNTRAVNSRRGGVET